MKRLGTAVILCGGKSSRMGFDKSKLKLGNKLLLEIVAEKLEGLFEEVLLVAERKDKFVGLKYTVLEDLKKEYGPAGGIYTGLKHASSQYVFFLACDMPIVNIEYIESMMENLRHNDYDGVIPRRNNWVEPLHAFYSQSLIGDFEKGIMENNLVLYDIIRNSNILYIPEEVTKEYDPNMEMFCNLNYVDDLKILEKI
ncbi:molybdenum cofactor guanylyltransferase [Clostridium sp. A1-XYC3]|uniref:Probable molybdenum cofactor guanylyltransferase n=1 Tax=Clostridium tanneri TaxID=3037988 RepID=A0ABU4JV23_9CLOT|nr:molybdenum cofactor guanylyltransferase [Clostridium sp. A1-XYC3]MDW8801961.1 molybdenum cofactor guanylyltransferase [Clostridium sp. A1-XYC3]